MTNSYLDPVTGKGYGKPPVDISLPMIGQVRHRSTDEISGSNWLLGCETLDRDYADYDAYKEYLCPLGIHTLRLQGGWAKTERSPGIYDWGWLDHIVDDAIERGLRPWLQTGYGNPIYPGAGGSNLGAGMPLSEEGLAAYERWVTAMVTRYQNKVFDWEVWNEPNFADNRVNTPAVTADFNLRTARIIKSVQPQARISALALGHMDLEYVELFFWALSHMEGCELFHNVTYHDYVYNPDSNRDRVDWFRQIVWKYAPGLIIRQGENGAPSVSNAGGAMHDHAWSEISQAKWDLRRMLGNLGCDIECNVFSIAEMQYRGSGPITKTNTKGLLVTDSRNRVLRPKIAYFAVGHVTSIFDDTLRRIENLRFRHTVLDGDQDVWWCSTDRSVSVYGYKRRSVGSAYTYWLDDVIPSDDLEPKERDFVFAGADFHDPVLVELITGNVYRIPADRWKKEGNLDRFRGLPLFDSPMVLAERDLIPMMEEN